MSLHIRSRPRYLSEEVDRYLRLIAGSLSKGTEANLMPDQVADNLLRKIISQDYPELLERQAEIDEVEERMAESIRNRQ